ncbi:MAG TPA: efflux RND transporter periplasmic adaptor subunit, partial [Planctomycetaceae bacterium]|nr:efflux RND transporter periplasmic adaptor subunit [Planctomycetaceae bacterium]
DFQEPPLNVEVYRVERYPLREYLEAFGTARADREVVVSAEVSGKIVEVLPNLEVGELVTAKPYPRETAAGETPPAISPDRLVLIEQFGYEKRRDSAESRYREAQTEVDKIKKEIPSIERLTKLAVEDYKTYLAEYERRKELVAKGVGSKTDLSNFELNLNSFKKSKEQLENQLDQLADRKNQVEAKADGLKAEWELAQQDLEKTEILPPFDGYLSEVLVELGQYVRTGDPLVKITDLSRVEIPVSLTQPQYSKLKPSLDRGERPLATLSPHRDSKLRWVGRVVRVAPVSDERTRTIQAFIVVDNSTQEVPMLPGTFAFARIEGPAYDRNERFAVPRDAIIQNRVFVVEEGIAKNRQIEIVDTLQSFALVESGLVHGDEIVLTNLDVLREGDAVKFGEQIRTLKTELERDGNSVRAIEIDADHIASDRTGTNPPKDR